jgi:hypothetical protein
MTIRKLHIQYACTPVFIYNDIRFIWDGPQRYTDGNKVRTCYPARVNKNYSPKWREIHHNKTKITKTTEINNLYSNSHRSCKQTMQ